MGGPAVRILAIDDESKILDVLESYLVHAGYTVDRATNGRGGLESFVRNRPDLVVLDLMLPDITGEEVCRTIRRSSAVPVLMLTARVGEDAVVQGLNLGADDYLVKPFSPRELVARVQALLRRSSVPTAPSHPRPGEAPLPENRVLRSAGAALELDTRSCSARLDGRELDLTATEYRLLLLFMDHPNRVFSREDLVSLVMGDEFTGESRTMDAHIKNLRHKLDDRAHRYIQTVHGFGYRFDGGAL